MLDKVNRTHQVHYPDPLVKRVPGLPADGGHLLHHHPVDVPLLDHLLRLQPERRVLGNPRGAEEEDCRRNGAGWSCYTLVSN